MSKGSQIFRTRIAAGVWLGVLWLAVTPAVALAQAAPPPAAPQKPTLNYNAQVPIPGGSEEARALQKEQPVSNNLLGQYVVAIYRFGIWLAITLSIFMVMVGGFLWVIAGGSPERVNNAKSYITSALTGLVVALTSFLLLQTVNPELVVFKPLAGVTRLTNLANAAVYGQAKLDPNYGCTQQLVVDNVLECDAKCKGLGRRGAHLTQSGRPIAPPIPKSSKLCCACQDKPCMDVSQSCALGKEPGCCVPLVCNTDPNTCEPKHPGGTEWSVAVACEAAYDCLSSMCYDAPWSVYDYCVPEGGFPDGHECEFSLMCQDGSGCWSEGYQPSLGKSGPTPNPPACHPKRTAGAPCTNNEQCISNLCDTAVKHTCS